MLLELNFIRITSNSAINQLADIRRSSVITFQFKMRFNRIPLASRILSSLDWQFVRVAIRRNSFAKFAPRHVTTRHAVLDRVPTSGNAEPKIGLNFLFSFHRQLQKFTSMYQDQFRKVLWNVRGELACQTTFQPNFRFLVRRANVKRGKNVSLPCPGGKTSNRKRRLNRFYL